MTDQQPIKKKLTDLVPDQRNANKGTERGLRMLDDSLREDGAGRGILLDRNNNVIAGNKTLERAVDLGFEEVIIVPTDGKQIIATQRIDVDIDSVQGRRMALRDNRVGQVDLEFDGDVLRELADEGVDLSALWNEEELAELIGEDETGATDPGAQVDKAEELQAKWQVKPGDLWSIGKHRLLCGDSTKAEDVIKIMCDDYVLFCDPFFQDHMIDTLANNFDFSNAVFITGGPQLKEIILHLDKYLEGVFLGGVTIPQMGNTARLFYEHKVILWSYTTSLNFKLGQSSVIRSEDGSKRLYGDTYHHTAKPVDVCETLLSPFAQTEVIDCFAGTASSLVAAHRIGKRWSGIEIEPKYCAVILERSVGLGLEVKRA